MSVSEYIWLVFDTVPDTATVIFDAPDEESVRFPELEPRGAEFDNLAYSIPPFEFIEQDEDQFVLSLETWKFDGAVTVIFPDKQ